METVNSSLMSKNTPELKRSKKVSYIGTLRNLSKQMKDHHSGLVELLKNSADACLRDNYEKNESLGIIFFKNAKKGSPSKIGFLDFVGIEKDRKDNFINWNKLDASMGANTTAGDLFGGKGNGGKLYGLSLYDDAWWTTLKNQTSFKVGFESKSSSSKKILDKDLDTLHTENIHVTNPKNYLDNLLKQFNTKFKDLPKIIQDLILSKNGFTFFIGTNPKYYLKSIKTSAELKNITSHPEAILPLEIMNIYISENGRLQLDNSKNYKLLKPQIIKTHKDFPIQKTFEIPDTLVDPDTGENVDTKNTSSKILVIKSSELDMPNSKLRHRHIFTGRLSSGTLKKPCGFWKTSELAENKSGFSRHLYGEIYHDELDDYSSNNRTQFTSSPLIRALANYMSEKIDFISKEHVEKSKDKIKKDQKERIQNFQKKLEDILKKENFIKHKYGFLGDKDGPGDGPHTPTPPKKNNKVEKIEISLAHDNAGKGVVFRPKIRSFNHENEEIKNPNLSWHISDESVVREHERELNLLYTTGVGKTKIQVVSKENNVKSNYIYLNVINISKIILLEENLEVKDRTAKLINYKVIDNNNKLYASCYLTYTTNNSEIVKVSPNGLLSAKSVGKTELTAMTDDCLSNTVKVHIFENTDPPKPKKGGGFPKVLKSGIDTDPCVEGSTESLWLDESYPAVYQRREDTEKGVWWVNFQSPFASELFERANNKKQYSDGDKSAEFRTYFLEQYFNILARVNIYSNKDHQPKTLLETIVAIDDENVDFLIKIKPFIKDLLDSNKDIPN